MAKKASRKVRAMSPQALAAKRQARRAQEIGETAAIVGLPEAQRDADALTIVRVPQIGVNPRTTDRTVRRLTRVEKLRAAGVLEEHEALACEWYCDVQALAWDTVRCTSRYDIAGGGGGATAPDRLAAATIAIAEARDDYAYAKAAIPSIYVAMFEAIVCRNASISAEGERLFGHLQRSQRESKVRAAFKLCANRLHGQIGHRLSIG